jgi:hypothetical protein
MYYPVSVAASETVSDYRANRHGQQIRMMAVPFEGFMSQSSVGYPCCKQSLFSP